MDSGDYATPVGFVAAGRGVSLIPDLGLPGRHPGVVVRKVRNPSPVRAIHAALRSDSVAGPALTALLAALKKMATA